MKRRTAHYYRRSPWSRSRSVMSAFRPCHRYASVNGSCIHPLAELSAPHGSCRSPSPQRSLGSLLAPLLALDLPPLRSEGAPFFTADLAISLDRGQQPGISVSLTLPYTGLEWLRFMSAGSEALRRRGRVQHHLRGQGDIGQKGDVWERRFVVASMGETRAVGAVVADKRTFTLAPGRYQVRITATDLNSKARSLVQQKLDVPDYTRLPVGFSDLELGVVDSTGGFRPIPTRQFGMESGRIGARASLFDRRPGTGRAATRSSTGFGVSWAT